MYNLKANRHNYIFYNYLQFVEDTEKEYYLLEIIEITAYSKRNNKKAIEWIELYGQKYERYYQFFLEISKQKYLTYNQFKKCVNEYKKEWYKVSRQIEISKEKK